MATSVTLPLTPTLFPISHRRVGQHNALVNAHFKLTATESRLFLALLAHVPHEASAFAPCRVLAQDVMMTMGSDSSHEVNTMLQGFVDRTLRIEELDAVGRPLEKPDFTVIPLLAYATYLEEEGVIEAQLHDLLHRYLLELRDNFTQAQLTELRKLKSANSHRIYWLLRQYAAFRQRIIPLADLKAMLGLREEYDQFDDFRVRVLEPAREELAQTDLAFTYEAVKQGQEVTEIGFFFNK